MGLCTPRVPMPSESQALIEPTCLPPWRRNWRMKAPVTTVALKGSGSWHVKFRPGLWVVGSGLGCQVFRGVLGLYCRTAPRKERAPERNWHPKARAAYAVHSLHGCHALEFPGVSRTRSRRNCETSCLGWLGSPTVADKLMLSSRLGSKYTPTAHPSHRATVTRTSLQKER